MASLQKKSTFGCAVVTVLVGDGDVGIGAGVGCVVRVFVGDEEIGASTGDAVGLGVGSTGRQDSTRGEREPAWPFSVACSHAVTKAP